MSEVVLRMTDATSGFLQPSYLKEGFAAVSDAALATLLAERLAARPGSLSDAADMRTHLTALIEQHGLVHLVDELTGAARLDAVIDALVALIGWGELVTAVVTCKPRAPRPDAQIPDHF
jgi:hypothetical protein